MAKLLNRVQLRLFAPTYAELVQKQLKVSREKDKEFEFKDLREVYSKGEVVGYAVNYNYSLKPGDKVEVE